MTAVAVIAKECLPGTVKTRLQPEYTAAQAAAIAAAALADTLDVVRRLPATRHILYFDGAAAAVDAAGWNVVPQCTGTLDERIAHLFDLIDEPLLLLGMDTPQLDPDLLAPFFSDDGTDAWFGPATDGGFWALGMRRPDGELVRGVRMSTSRTGRDQLDRLRGDGLAVRTLPELTDIDTAADLKHAVRQAPRLRQVVRALERERGAA